MYINILDDWPEELRAPATKLTLDIFSLMLLTDFNMSFEALTVTILTLQSDIRYI